MSLNKITAQFFSLLLIFIGSGHHAVAQGKGDTPSKPNIVLIITDQQTAQAMSNAGNNDLSTPSMDKLAARGTRFTQAYCPQPLCGPSRSSMLTGQLPNQLGASINLPEKSGYWNQDVQMLGKIFKEDGYNTGYIGKWHLPVPVVEKDFHGFDFITNTVERDWQDASIPADCNDFLKQQAKQQGDKPFLMVASFINPHDICEWARDYPLRMELLNEPPTPDQCPEIPDNYEIPEGEPDILRQLQKRSWNTYPTTDWNKDRWRQYRWAYYRLIEKVDLHIGRVLHALEKNKLADNTIIVFLSDHGDGAGSHRWNQKQVLYQESVNVPLIVSDPWNTGAKVNSKQLVNLGLDLIPTLCDYAGIQVPSHLTGESFKKYVSNANNFNADKITVLETEFSQGPNSYDIKGRALITGSLKYIVYSKGDKREQLFDLESDPGEMNDLTLNKSFDGEVKTMRSRLKDWCKAYQDDFVSFID